MSNQNTNGLNGFGAILGGNPQPPQQNNTPPVNNDAFANANMTGFNPNEASPFGGSPVMNTTPQQNVPFSGTPIGNDQPTPFGGAYTQMPPSLSDMPDIPPKPTDKNVVATVQSNDVASKTKEKEPHIKTANEPVKNENLEEKVDAKTDTPLAKTTEKVEAVAKAENADEKPQSSVDTLDESFNKAPEVDKPKPKTKPDDDAKDAKEKDVDRNREIKDETKAEAEKSKPKSTQRTRRQKKSALGDLLKLVETELTKHDDVKARLDAEFTKHDVETHVNYEGDTPVLESKVANYTLQYTLNESNIDLTINDGKENVTATYNDLDDLVRYMHYLVPHLTK